MQKKLAIGLVYNLKKPPDEEVPIDAYAEFESTETVNLIVDSLLSFGCTVQLIPFHDHSVLTALANSSVDLFFNIAEGIAGARNRESLVPAVLELLDKPYTGSDPTTLGLTLDKALAKTIVGAGGVPIPLGKTLFKPTLAELEQALAGLGGFPLVVKPQWEGSSKGVSGTSLVKTMADLSAEVNRINLRYNQPALAEEFLPGREFSVGIIGYGESVRVLPVLEVVYTAVGLTDFVYSYEVKSQNAEELVCPAQVASELADELSRLSVKAFTALGCRDCGRVDFRLDSEGRARFLEINPLPGLSRDSLYPLQARAAGMSHPELLKAIIESALHRNQKGEANDRGKLAKLAVAASESD